MSKLPPYKCIRCGYESKQKSHMREHLFSKSKPCHPIKNDIELTTEIKDKILEDRFYKIPKKIVNTSKPEIIDNGEDEYYYIYLVRPKENVRHKENIYKIGKTKVTNPEINVSRLSSYGKGTEIIYLSQCKNCDILEREIIEEFNKKFEKHSGNEYFIGNKFDMINLIAELTLKHNKN